MNAVFLILLVLPRSVQDGEIDRLIEQLGSAYQDEREQARKKLLAFGKQAEPALVQAFRRGDSRIRLLVLDLLRGLGNTTEVETVGELFLDAPDEETRRATFEYLAAAGKSAEPYLIEALGLPGDYYRRTALGRLKEFRSLRAVPKVYELYKQLDYDQPDLQRMAFDVIKAAGHDAKDFLVRFLDDAEPSFRSEALEALTGLQDEAVLKAVADLLRVEVEDSVIRQGFEFLKRVPRETSEDLLIGLLQAQAPLTQRGAIRGLARIKSEKALERVLQAARRTEDLDVKEECIEYFATFPGKTQEYLLKLLADPLARIRRRVIEELGKRRSRIAYEKIREILKKDPDVATRRRAFEYFRTFGREAADVFLEALHDEDPEIREMAIRVIADLRIEKGILPLVRVLTGASSRRLRELCVDALGRIGPAAIRRIEEAAMRKPELRDLVVQVRRVYDDSQVEGVLGRYIVVDEKNSEETTGAFEGQFRQLASLPIGTERTVSALFRMLDPDYTPRTERCRRIVNRDLIRRLAALALGTVGGEEAKARLAQEFEKLFGRPDEYDAVVEDVAVALARLGDRSAVDRLIGRVQKEMAEIRKEDPMRALEMEFAINLIRNRSGDRVGALAGYSDLAARLEKRTDRDPVLYASTLYNVACLHSLLGHRDEAVRWLRKAVEAGFRMKDWIEMDRDLDPIRNHPGYEALMKDENLFRGN